MLVEKNITFYSNCEHHFVPIFGKAHVAYMSSGKVIGLSKINRIVDYFARRPQVQERLTNQIGNDLKEILGTEDVYKDGEIKDSSIGYVNRNDKYSWINPTLKRNQATAAQDKARNDKANGQDT